MIFSGLKAGPKKKYKKNKHLVALRAAPSADPVVLGFPFESERARVVGKGPEALRYEARQLQPLAGDAF